MHNIGLVDQVKVARLGDNNVNSILNHMTYILWIKEQFDSEVVVLRNILCLRRS